MSRFKLLDAQAALGFVVSQTTYIERQVNEIVYPDIQYPQLIPVDTSAPEWIKTVTFYSADKVGKADWVNGNADDLPLASTERSKFESSCTWLPSAMAMVWKRSARRRCSAST